VELLEYLAPRDGRSAPHDLRPNDLAHWQTRLAVHEDATIVPEAGDWTPAVAAPVRVEGPELRFREGYLIRDPDGHGVLLARPGERKGT
jgi:hypothetical protein